MKSIIETIIILLFSNMIFADNPKQQVKQIDYNGDRLDGFGYDLNYVNFNHDIYDQYIGHEFYFLPKADYSKEEDRFLTTFFVPTVKTYHKGFKSYKSNIYMDFFEKNKLANKTPYQYIEGKTFKVIAVEKNYDRIPYNEDMYNCGIFYTLVSKENNDTIVWQIPCISDSGEYLLRFKNRYNNYHYPPILVKSYLERIQNHLSNNELYITSSFRVKDEYTNDSINVRFGRSSKWMMKDIVLESHEDCVYLQAFMYVENELGNLIKLHITYILGESVDNNKEVFHLGILGRSNTIESIVRVDEYEALIDYDESIGILSTRNEKYLTKEHLEKVEEYFKSFAVQGLVKKGMPKELCRIAWGDPIKEEDGYNYVVWRYSDNSSLFFEKDKLFLVLGSEKVVEENEDIE